MRYSILALMGVLTITTLAVLGCARSPTRVAADPAQSEQGTLIRYQFARVLMGSRCTITIEARNEAEAARAASRAFDEILRIERVLSDYDPNSEAMRVMRGQTGTPHPISETLLEVLLLSRDVHIASEGAFDPTVGAITHLWRRAADESRIPSNKEIENALGRVGFDILQIDHARSTLRFDHPGMILDFGGIGKGYAASAGIRLLRELGYPAAFINLGGDLQLGDPPSDQPDGWRIEVFTGIHQNHTMRLHNTGVATSGDLDRFFEHDGVRYSHIIDPRTGRGITERRAVTVVADDATLADAIASAVSVFGERGEQLLRETYPDISVTLVSTPFEEDD